MADPAGNRTVFDIAEEFLRRPGGVAGHREHRKWRGQIGNFSLRRADLRAERPSARGVDGHALAFELQVRVESLDRRPLGKEAQRPVAYLERDEKLSRAIIGKGKIGEVARQVDAHVARGALEDAGLEPGAQAAAQSQGNVAAHLVHVAPSELRAQVQRARAVAFRGPRSVRRARERRTGKAHVVERHAPWTATLVPRHRATHGGHGQRFTEHPGRVEHQVPAVEFRRALRLIQVEGAGDTGCPRHALHRSKSNALQGAAGGKGVESVSVAGPAEFAVGDGAARRVSRKIAAHARRQRQLGGQCGQRFRVEVVDDQLPARDTALRTLAHIKAEVGGGQREIRARRKREVGESHLALAAFAFPVDVPAQVGEVELRQIARKPRAHIDQLEIRHHAGRGAFGEVEPRAKRALAAVDRDRQRNPLPPQRDVGVVQPHVEASARFAPIAQRRVGHVATKIQRRGEVGRRRADQAEAVVTKAVLEAKLHVVQHQLRRLAQFIRPGHQRVGDHDTRLPQQPIGDARVVVLLLGIEFDARHVQTAACVAANRQLRLVDG